MKNYDLKTVKSTAVNVDKENIEHLPLFNWPHIASDDEYNALVTEYSLGKLSLEQALRAHRITQDKIGRYNAALDEENNDVILAYEIIRADNLDKTTIMFYDATGSEFYHVIEREPFMSIDFDYNFQFYAYKVFGMLSDMDLASYVLSFAAEGISLFSFMSRIQIDIDASTNISLTQCFMVETPGGHVAVVDFTAVRFNFSMFYVDGIHKFICSNNERMAGWILADKLSRHLSLPINPDIMDKDLLLECTAIYLGWRKDPSTGMKKFKLIPSDEFVIIGDHELKAMVTEAMLAHRSQPDIENKTITG